MEEQVIKRMKKITKNFLVVSNYYNHIDWVGEYTDNYLVYDQSGEVAHPNNLDPKKVIKSPHLGHNIRDYCTYIIDHYDALPECVIFATGNVFPRHVSEAYFQKVMNNDFFTPIEDYRKHTEKWPAGFFSADGGFCEINNSWYLKNHPTKYFHDYNDFLRYCFTDPLIPRYNRFAPGANYVVPRANILKLPKIFYENLRVFVSHCPTAIPGESHIIERALYTLWNCNFEINENMLKPVNDSFVALPPVRHKSFSPLYERMLRKIKYEAKLLNKTATQAVRRHTRKLFWHSPKEIAEYRKRIKIYDVFTLYNELDLLEIRMNILDSAVDYFVIIEATETFSGKPKPLHFEENRKRFKQWEHKIIYHVTSDTPKDQDELRSRLAQNPNMSELDKSIIHNALTSDNIAPGAIHWFKEFYQKESIKKALVGLSDNDICFIGDVDEIWNPAVIIDYTKDDIFKLRQKVYTYYLNNRSNEPWAGTLVTKYKNIKNNCLNHLRTARKTEYTKVSDGGWHFTNQGGVEQIKKKLESYGHQEYNTEEIKTKLQEKINTNSDFIGRGFKFWIEERDLPEFIIKNKKKYQHMFKQ